MKFYISLANPKIAQGANSAFSFSAHSAPEFAAQLQRALSNPAYIQSWLSSLDSDEAELVSAELLAIDANAKVTGQQHDLSFSLLANTSINGAAFKHRMRLLAGTHWQLTDVK
jgi:hypothetical protein